MNKHLIIAATIAAFTCSCMKQEAEKPLIGKQNPKIENRQFTPEVLWAMGRLGSVSVNPRTGKIAYTVSYYSVEQNKSNSELFLMNADGSDNQQITHTAKGEHNPEWLNNDKLAHLRGGKIVVDDQEITGFDKPIEGFAFSLDNSKVLFISQVKTVESTADKYPDLPLASGRVVDDLMYKHWDEWTESAPHPFIADFDGKTLTNIVNILAGEPYEAPMKPFGGMEQLAWSPDGQYVAYTCRKKIGLEYAISTNSDIYLYSLADGTTINLTKGNLGYDTNPQFSPDGTMIAWQSMERDGYESDQNRLMVLNLRDAINGVSTPAFVSRAFESNIDEFIWFDNSSFLFAGVWFGTEQLYYLTLDGKICAITEGVCDNGLAGLSPDKKTLYLKRHSMIQADELYALNISLLHGYQPTENPMLLHPFTEVPEGLQDITQITFENQHIYEAVDIPTVRPRWQRTTDHKEMLTWVIYPPHFDPTKKYPTLLFCEGGPQTPVSQFWSYRWNFMVMASQGYIVVAPNRRGLPGFGNEWNEQISGDYGGQCMKDYLSSIDEICKNETYIDTDHLGCVGASFGGYSVYWLAGHHDKRFKAFIAHDGIFNMEMQYLETEEKWFANWDMGGAYWEKDNKIAQRTFANSPHRFVDKWDTPILCIHGEKDYRILANQAMAAFDAAKMRGVPAQLLIFPDENHWVLQPQNGILWQRTYFKWLDRWLKK